MGTQLLQDLGDITSKKCKTNKTKNNSFSVSKKIHESDEGFNNDPSISLDKELKKPIEWSPKRIIENESINTSALLEVPVELVNEYPGQRLQKPNDSKTSYSRPVKSPLVSASSLDKISSLPDPLIVGTNSPTILKPKKKWWSKLLNRTKSSTPLQITKQMEILNLAGDASGLKTFYQNRLTDVQIRAREKYETQLKLAQRQKEENKSQQNKDWNQTVSSEYGTNTCQKYYPPYPYIFGQLPQSLTKNRIQQVPNRTLIMPKSNFLSTSYESRITNPENKAVESNESKLLSQNIMSFFDQRCSSNDKANLINKAVQAKQIKEYFELDDDPDQKPPPCHSYHVAGIPVEMYGGSNRRKRTPRSRPAKLFRMVGLTALAKDIEIAAAQRKEKKEKKAKKSKQYVKKKMNLTCFLCKQRPNFETPLMLSQHLHANHSSNTPIDVGNGGTRVLPSHERIAVFDKPVENSSVADVNFGSLCIQTNESQDGANQMYTPKPQDRNEQLILKLTEVLQSRITKDIERNKDVSNHTNVRLITEETHVLALFNKCGMTKLLRTALKDIGGKKYGSKDPFITGASKRILNNNYQYMWQQALISINVSESTIQKFISKLEENSEIRKPVPRRTSSHQASVVSTITYSPAASTSFNFSKSDPKPELDVQHEDHHSGDTLSITRSANVKVYGPSTKTNSNTKQIQQQKNSNDQENSEIETSESTLPNQSKNAEVIYRTSKRVTKPRVRYSPSQTNPVRYCICRRPARERDGPMVNCDTCKDWFHYGDENKHCDYIDDGEKAEWHCEACRKKCKSNNPQVGSQTPETVSNTDSQKQTNVPSEPQCQPTPDFNGQMEDLTDSEDNEIASQSVNSTQAASSIVSSPNGSGKSTLCLERTNNIEVSTETESGNNTESNPDEQSDQSIRSETDTVEIEANDNQSLEMEQNLDLSVDDIELDRKTICTVLKLMPEDLEFTPPMEFEIIFSPEEVNTMFDFNQNKFTSNRGSTISKKITKCQGVCSFNSSRVPSYYQTQNKFARLDGYCAGSCQMQFILMFPNQPEHGKPLTAQVTTRGGFVLVQSKPTGRQIRNFDRKVVAEKLKSQKSNRLYLENYKHVEGLRVLHNNLLQRSQGALRKLRSEIKAARRISKISPMEDLLELEKQYKAEHYPSYRITGYLQNVNPSPSNLHFHMYDAASIGLLAAKLQSGIVRLGIDASGSFIRSLATEHGEKRQKNNIFLYTIVAECEDGTTFVPAEMVTRPQSNVEVNFFLDKVSDAVKKTNQYIGKAIADYVVVDMSWSLLHGICRGINNELITDYFRRSYDFWQDKCDWPKDKACIFSCTSHLMKAFQTNLSRKLGTSRKVKPIKDIAMKCLARLHENTTIQEFDEVSSDICYIFAKQDVDEQLLNQAVERIQTPESTQLVQDVLLEKECIDNINREIDDMGNTSLKLLREKSPMHNRFVKILQKVQEINTGDSAVNPYYNDCILNILKDTYIPLHPLFSRGTIKKAKDPNFLRATNGCVESKYRNYKHELHPQRNEHVGDFIRDHFDFHTGQDVDFIRKSIQRCHTKKLSKTSCSQPDPILINTECTIVANKKTQKRKSRRSKSESEDPTESANAMEIWSRRGKSTKHPKHVLPRLALTYLDRQRYQANRSADNDATTQYTNTEHSDHNVEIDEEESIEQRREAFLRMLEEQEQDQTREQHILSELCPETGEAMPGDDAVLFRINEFSLRKKEFHHFFHGDMCISDDTINEYLCQLKQNAEADSQIIFVAHSAWLFHHYEIAVHSGTIEAGWQSLPDMSSGIQQNEKFIMHPLKIGYHWILSLIDLDKSILYIMDPLLSPSNQEAVIEALWRYEELCAPLQTSNTTAQWKVEFLGVPQQTDVSSCGVRVLKMAADLFRQFPKLDCFSEVQSEFQLRLELVHDLLRNGSGPGLRIFEKYENRPDTLVSYLQSDAAENIETM